ncbi:GD16417 [Drosophila simulans]|uniref:GD16417 n=1 Tax=Drosophila simulans TaxID=7240 RepID=B4R301_DROSI|nr:GD16417 [Drosophila simulans]
MWSRLEFAYTLKLQAPLTGVKSEVGSGLKKWVAGAKSSSESQAGQLHLAPSQRQDRPSDFQFLVTGGYRPDTNDLVKYTVSLRMGKPKTAAAAAAAAAATNGGVVASDATSGAIGGGGGAGAAGAAGASAAAAHSNSNSNLNLNSQHQTATTTTKQLYETEIL